jgi:hypothetical protein
MLVIAAVIAGVWTLINVAAVIFAVVLNFTQILDWFQRRRTNIPEVDRSRLSFTLQDILASGRYRTVQGVFNRVTNQVEEGARSITSTKIDNQLRNYHRGYRLVTYE